MLIRADSNRLRQVFLNLAINAVDAICGKGKVLIATEIIKEYHDDTQSWIVISFTDNGMGIPEENFNKIFDPFFTTMNVGTGLGLTVSHKIIQDHRGIIEVESRVDEGTTFYVRLPWTPDENRS